MASKRLKPDRVPVRRQGPGERTTNFDEVALGYASGEARAEADRCLMCRKPTCVQGCPVGIDIPGFVSAVKEGKTREGIDLVKQANLLPGVCGRVCPQETQCEEQCILGKKGDPLAIGKLERFVADWEAEQGEGLVPQLAEPTGRSAAVIGSGPAGLTAAAELARFGHRVTVYEALHVAGGVLTYGIPEFRLPQRVVDREVGMLERMGVEIVLDFVAGRTITLAGLMEMYDSVFVGIGAGLPGFMGIPGENLNGVYSANEFLTRSNLMLARSFPEYDTPVRRGRRVAVVGGGNVAMDSARTALRMGAERVNIVYRRSRVEMPARVEEVEHGAEEGVVFHMLSNPVEVLGEQGSCRAVVCQRMELGEPDESGRRRPVPLAGDFFTLDVDVLVMAIGTGANPLLTSTVDDLELNRRGYIQVDPESFATSLPGLYAGGDIVTGSATVIEAMGAGKSAAVAMDAYMRDY
ncbi:MAG: NADPH-dependent glutamate synthase [Actinobacteria bacterium]|nr:NADPH-dependent glutamate synthase [Actinomycetota bacterium]